MCHVVASGRRQPRNCGHLSAIRQYQQRPRPSIWPVTRRVARRSYSLGYRGPAGMSASAGDTRYAALPTATVGTRFTAPVCALLNICVSIYCDLRSVFVRFRMYNPTPTRVQRRSIWDRHTHHCMLLHVVWSGTLIRSRQRDRWRSPDDRSMAFWLVHEVIGT
jgi:hypothetical protein